MKFIIELCLKWFYKQKRNKSYFDNNYVNNSDINIKPNFQLLQLAYLQQKNIENSSDDLHDYNSQFNYYYDSVNLLSPCYEF